MAKQTMQQHANTFSKGMNKDLDYSLMEPNMYLHAENLRLVADEANSTGALENVKGNTIIITKDDIKDASSDTSEYYTLIGYTSSVNKAILFLVGDTESHSAIYQVIFDKNTVSSYKELYNDSELITKLGWDKDTKISAILKKENENIEHLYWVDNNTNVSKFNIVGAPDSLKQGGNFITPENFKPTPSFPLDSTNIELASIGNGLLETGMVQYSYRFISSNGSQSTITAPTGLYHITKSDEFASSTRTYTGTDTGENCNKSFTFEVTVDSSITDVYDTIEPISIYYKDFNSTPQINLLTQISMNSGTTTYKFTDRGSGYMGNLTLTEYLVETNAATSSSSLISRAKIMDSKDNRLFLADVSTRDASLDVSGFDTRAFRYNRESVTSISIAKDATIESSTSNTMLLRLSGSYSFAEAGDHLDIILPLTDSFDLIPKYFTVKSLSVGGSGSYTDIVIYHENLSRNSNSATINPTNTSTSYIEESNGDYTYIINNERYIRYDSSNTIIERGLAEDLIQSIDAINTFNYGSVLQKDYKNKFKYKSDGTTLGAEGPNIEVEFEHKEITLDNSGNIKANYSTDKNNTYGFESFASPYYTANFKHHQLDEIYRYSIKFFDDEGNETIPSWICDLRMPHILDDDKDYFTFESGTLKGNIYSPKFIIKRLPDNTTSYQILRVERTTNDKSIISQGTVRPTMINARNTPNRGSGSGENWQTCVHHEAEISDFNGSDHQDINIDLLEFYSPEISFYKASGFPLNGDYMEVLGYMNYDFYTDTNYFLGTPIIKEQTGGGYLRSQIFKYYGPITADASIDNLDETVILRSEEQIQTDVVNDIDFNSYTIAGYTYWPYLVSPDFDKDRLARKTSGMVYKTNYNSESHITKQSGTAYAPFNYDGNKEFKNPMLANYKRDNYDTMYGGNTYSARENNQYIPVSNIVYIGLSISRPDEITPYNGDMFITACDIQPISYEYAVAEGILSTEISMAEVDIVPVETSINTELRMGDYVTKFDQLDQNIKYINEDGFEDQDLDPMYVYNTIYSEENDLVKRGVITQEQQERTANVFNNRVVASNKKISGEKIDNWFKFPANNYLDVDSNYGDIIELKRHADRLYYFQERAVGVLSVNERSLVQDQSGQQLALGTGTLLSRYDYVSTSFGCSHRESIVETMRGIYWFDVYSNSIVRMARDQYNNLQVISLSKANSMQPFMNKYDFTSCVSGKDEKHDEVLFTLNNDSGDIYTLVFNERMGVFQSFYSIEAARYEDINRHMLSTDNSQDLYIHSRDDANYGEFYGTVNNSTLKILVSPNIGLTKVFDVMNYINQSEDSEGNFQFYDTFDQIRVYNTYQNSDWVTLVYDDTITKRGKDWSLQIPRNAVTVDLEENPDIFSDANLDKDKDYKERMRDKYLFVDFVYQNDDGYRFNIPVVITKYRVSFR